MSVKKFLTGRLFIAIIIAVVLVLLILPSAAQYYFTRSEREGQFANTIPVARSPKLISGTTNKELFAAITKPQYIDTKEASSFLKADDKIYLVRTQEGVYAYPYLILGWHHIVNETFDQKPVAVTLCALTDTGLLDSRVLDGKIVNFGVLGSLYLGNLIMYDDKSNTPWLQMTNEEVSNTPSSRKVTTLSALEYTTWDRIKSTNNIKVLAPVRTIDFYRGFESRIATLEAGLKTLKFYQQPDTRLPAYDTGLGVQVHGASTFYPATLIKQEDIIEDSVGGWNILVASDPRFDSPKIFRRYLDGKVLDFQKEGDHLVDKQTGTTWDFDGNATVGTLKGRKLESLQYTPAYWFAWAGFYPKTSYYR